MSLSIKRIIKVDFNEWISVWNECEWSTFYESIDWYRTWDHFVPVNTHYEAFKYEFSDGISCIIPLFFRRLMRGLQEFVEISPGGLYGGPLSSQKLTPDHVNLLYTHLSKKFPNLEFHQNPYMEVSYSNPENDSIEFTQTLDLLTDEVQTEKAFNKHKVAYDARLALKNGLQIKLANHENITKFNELYQKAKLRWKRSSSTYNFAFFRSLIESDKSDFWGVFNEYNDFIGGGIMCKGKRSVSSWLAIMDENHLRYRPYEFYYHYLFWHYKSEGYHWLDLNPSGKIKGVIDFKSKFSPVTLQINTLSQKSKAIKISEALIKRFK
jgi:hypothetical protein